MSFGFVQPRREFALQLKQALNKEVLVFAAASNGGASTSHASQTWPANDGRVFGAYSANFLGKGSDFNPPERQGDGFSHFKFLGEDVESAWPKSAKRGGHTPPTQEVVKIYQSPLQRMSGTSVAAPVAAATAAVFIEFVQQNKEGDDELEDLVKSPEGMKDIFNEIGVPKTGHILKFVLPWHLIQVESTRRDSTRQAIITRAINKVNEALYMKRLAGDEYPGHLLVALDAIEEQEAQRKKEFGEEENRLREESHTALVGAGGGSSVVAGLLAAGTLASGPLMPITGAFLIPVGGWAVIMLFWRALRKQRVEAGYMLDAAVLRKAQLKEEVAKLTKSSTGYESASNSILENVSAAVAIAEEKTQIRLKMIQFGLDPTGVDWLHSSQWDDSHWNSDPRVRHPADDAYDAMKNLMEFVRSYRGRWMGDIEFLVLCAQSLAAATVEPSTRPPLLDPPSNFSAKVRTILFEKGWYTNWQTMDILRLRSACDNFVDRLLFVALDLSDDLEKFQTLESQLRRSVYYLKQFNLLRERISKFEQEQNQEERDPVALRIEHMRHLQDGRKSWVYWFLGWLKLLWFLS